MENITIGIVSTDKDFAKALGLSLMAVCDDFIIKTYETRLFVSEWNAYKGEGDYSREFDLILWDGREVEDSYRGNIIYLAEKASQVRMDFNSGKFSIYKYCGAPAMSASIFEIYSKLTGRGRVLVRKDKVNLLAFGSWEGGCGCTTVALAVAQELRRFRGKKVLILSLETIESTTRYFGFVPELKCIGEYLYRVLPDETITGEKTTPFIESYIMKDLYGIEAFAPSMSRNPLADLSEKDMQKLVAGLIDSGRYDAILIDMGTCLTRAATAVMEMADRICFVTASLSQSRREEMYMGHVMVSTGEDTLTKAVRLTNMWGGGDAPEDKTRPSHEQFVSLGMKARRSEDIISSGESRQLVLDGAFGDDMRKLTGMLLRR